ncbi:MAG: 2-oxo acid dehydrogenase subunit E2 [Anaerolineales bacterium]
MPDHFANPFDTSVGWGIPVASHTLNVTVGGIAQRAVLSSAGVTDQEHLCITVSFDHDLIDGAPAARFLQRFQDIISAGQSIAEIAA